MKNLIFFVIIFSSFFASAQKRKIYYTSQDQYIISFSNHENDIPRFTFFPNYEGVINYDFSKVFGVYGGLSIKNIGIIYDNGTKHKVRSLGLSSPIAIKFGNLEKEIFFSLGAEYDILFHTKEKTFVGDTKTKESSYFSSKTKNLLPSVSAGVCYKRVYLRFKYYLQDYLNNDYSVIANGVKIEPFKNMKSQISYISISYRLKNFGMPQNIQKKQKNSNYNASIL